MNPVGVTDTSGEPELVTLPNTAGYRMMTTPEPPEPPSEPELRPLQFGAPGFP